MSLPTKFQANAWTGQQAGSIGTLVSDVRLTGWAIKERVEIGRTLKLAASAPPNMRDWQNPDVGWGIVLADNEAIVAGARCRPDDAVAAIQKLWQHRGCGPVFRYRDDLHRAKLRRYFENGTHEDVRLPDSEFGIQPGKIPRYLLIVGDPVAIPWEFQFAANVSRFVGRLDLDTDGLQNYVTALIDNWSHEPARSTHPVIWSVDHNEGDITHLMRKAIAEPIAESFATDNDLKNNLNDGLLFGDLALGDNLITALSMRSPSFILTTSHGHTAPLADPTLMIQTLGIPVDHQFALLDVDKLLDKWSPAGAVWYAHACCGAGCAASSQFAGLFPPSTSLAELLNGIATIGSKSSPLPRRLLSCKNPLRAFIGHVEPTFDWTIRDKDNGQLLTSSLRKALYNGLFQVQPETVGMAMEGFFQKVGPLFMAWKNAHDAINSGNLAQASTALMYNLAALDRSSLVILGDPTVTIPKL